MTKHEFDWPDFEVEPKVLGETASDRDILTVIGTIGALFGVVLMWIWGLV